MRLHYIIYMFTYPKKSVIFIIADNSALARLRNKERERMNSLNDIWSSVLAVLGQNLTATALNTWFDDCTPVEIVNNRLVIHIEDVFFPPHLGDVHLANNGTDALEILLAGVSHGKTSRQSAVHLLRYSRRESHIAQHISAIDTYGKVVTVLANLRLSGQ